MDSSSTRYILTQGLESCTEKEYDRDVSPLSAIHQGSPIEFQIPGTSIFYITLRDSYFDLQCQIVLPDGGNIPNDATVGPVNLIPHALFSNIELHLNGKQITEPTNHYPYRAYLETLTNYSTDVLDHRMILEGWTADTAGQFDVTNGHAGNNAGLITRAGWFAGSRVVRFLFQPHLDMFHQDSDIPPNTDIRIRLIPHRAAFYLMAGVNNIAYRIIITNMRIWLRTREVTSSCLLLHQSQLHSGSSFLIAMPSVHIKTLTIPANSLRQEFDNIYMGQLPHRILLAMVHDEHMSGQYGSNPFNLQHFGLSSLAIRVNGEQIPRVAYQPDFGDEHDYKREFCSLLSALDLDHDTGRTLCLTPDQWAQGFTFFAFRLSPNHSSSQLSGSVRLEIRFSAANANIINIILLSESSSAIEIDKYKNVLSIN